MTQESQEWYDEVLSATAKDYKRWFERYDIKFVSWEELGELLKDGLDEERIWTWEDMWDSVPFTLSTGDETTYRGGGYTPHFEGYPDSDETHYAISPKALSSEDSSILDQVLLTCISCVDEDGDEDPDPDCEFCEGELEVRFDLKEDGTYQPS